MSEEPIYNIGQHVRHILNRSMFSKGTLSKWSKTVHTIVSSTLHSYILENGKSYKYYELQPVDVVEKLEKQSIDPSREQLNQQRKETRDWKKTGLDKSNILTSKRAKKINA